MATGKVKKRLAVVALAMTFAVGNPPSASACCGDGEVAAEGAVAAGTAVGFAITAATAVIVAWLERMTMTIASGFGKVLAGISQQTAALRTMEEGNAAVLGQIMLTKAGQELDAKYQVSPRVCFETAGGAAATVAAGEVRQTINDLNKDFARRTLFTPNTTASVANIYDTHAAKYCSQQDADLGRCRAVDATLQNADVRADATLNTSSYTVAQLDAARAFVDNIANPMPTQNIPKDFEKSAEGRTFIAGQYVEQARASVAANSLNAAIAARVPVKGLGSAALLNKPDVSEMELMESQVRGRFESPAWYQVIAGFSAENLLREMNKQQALKLWMDLKSYQQMERVETVLATQLAMEVKRDSDLRLRQSRDAALKAGKQ